MAEQQIMIEIDDQTAAGKYSNLAVISHSENEFIMDYVFIHPPKGKVVARIISSPSHAKRLMRALEQNVELYEKAFGTIKEAPEPPKFGIEFSKN